VDRAYDPLHGGGGLIRGSALLVRLPRLSAGADGVDRVASDGAAHAIKGELACDSVCTVGSPDSRTRLDERPETSGSYWGGRTMGLFASWPATSLFLARSGDV
jgi:hypothetical protein